MSYSSVILGTSGLVSYWRLGEPSGTTAADSKSTNTGTYSGGFTLGQTGLLTGDSDTAVAFNGSTGEVTIADVPALRFTGATAISVEAWVKPNALPAGYSGGLVSQNGWWLGIEGAAPYFGFNSPAGYKEINAGTLVVGAGAHVVGTYDGANLKLYVNGALVGTLAYAGSLSGGSGSIFLAQDGQFLNGTLDEPAVYNVALSAATVLDHYQAGTQTGPYTPAPSGSIPAPTTLSPSPPKPPLGLKAVVTGADGNSFDWGSNGQAADRPQGVTFRTQRGEGFADASCTLPRHIDRDYPDLHLLDDFALVGADGSTAYEGRLAGNPRSLDTGGHSITPQHVGWMAHTKDKKFAEVYVDRDLSGWGEAPLNRRVSVSLAGVSTGDFSYSSDAGGLICALPNQALSGLTQAEVFYVAPVGVSVAKVMYVGASTSLPAGWAQLFRAGPDDALATSEPYTPTLDGTLRTVSLSTVRRYLMHTTTANGIAATPAAGANDRFSALAVYGSHGLTTRPVDSLTPDGLFVSDIIRDILGRFCPKLSTAGVQDTSYPLQQAAFRDRTFPYDAIQLLNGPHNWECFVWEKKTYSYEPVDLTDYDWEVRLGEPGTTIQLQGDSTDDLANAVVVTFQDLATGQQNTLLPTDHPELVDASVENEANRHGLDKWLEIELSVPATAADAAQLGAAALAEFNQPKAPGTIKVTGHIRDRAGHWQQGWKVRAGDRVSITNHPNDRPRFIQETTWDDETRTITIAVDSTFKRLDAVLDRFGTALKAAGLA